MKKAVKLDDFSIRGGGVILVHYDDGSSEIESVIELENKVYSSFAVAKGVIMRHIKSKFGKEVEISEDLQDAINNLADLLCYPADEEEEEAEKAAGALRKIEMTDKRRERWLYQRRK